MTSGNGSGTASILEVRDISIVRGDQKVLAIPSLQILPNDVLALIGPNGAGKTTLLLCLALLLKPTTGAVLFREHPVHNGSSALRLRRKFAVVFQEPLLLNTSVADNINLGLRMRGVNRAETRERTEKWLTRMGISHLAHRQARTLSGGEAQRTSLARAFALQPEILFLDEPFAALDTPTRQSLLQEIAGVLSETRITTVLVTHDHNEALTLANRVAVMMKGHIEQLGSPREVFSCPANEDIARFVGVENILQGKVISSNENIVEVKVNGHHIQGIADCRFTPVVKPGQDVYVCIRPEDITLSVQKSSTSARNVFEARIDFLTSYGALTRVNLDCGFPLIALITRLSETELQLSAGKTLYASFKATAIHVIGTV